MHRSRHITLMAIFVAFAASAGLLRVAHDLTAHICSCVTDAVLVEHDHDHAHDGHDHDHAHHGHDHDHGHHHDRGHDHHNHKHPADEHDCDLCAVLVAAHHAVTIDATTLVTRAIVVVDVPTPLSAAYADAPAHLWTARGPPARA